MGSGGKVYSIADAQEFVRRGLATQTDVDKLIQNNTTSAGAVAPSNRGKDARAQAGAEGATGLRSAKQPNKTEAEYGRILEAMKRRREIVEYRYEGITLKWAGMRYTPDWFVIVATPFPDSDKMSLEALDTIFSAKNGEFVLIKFIEVKGGHIWDRDLVRFKGARAAWPMFAFEMHQKKGGEWRRIH